MIYKRKKNYWQRAIRWSDYARSVLLGALLIGVISYLFYESLWAALFLSPLVGVWLFVWERSFAKKKQQQFQLQFKDAIQAVSAALNVGYSVENAWKEAAKEMRLMHGEQAMICKEFQYMIRQLDMNVTLEKVLEEFSEKTEDEEVQTFAAIFIMAKRSGANMMEIIRIAANRICDKVDRKRELETIISSKKTEFRIMAIIPLAMICYMKISFGSFIQILYGNMIGTFVMTLCLILYVGAYLVGRKMVEIEV